jgi:hypothetical protein
VPAPSIIEVLSLEVIARRCLPGLVALAALGCNGVFRFDDVVPAEDAAPIPGPADAAAPAAAAADAPVATPIGPVDAAIVDTRPASELRPLDVAQPRADGPVDVAARGDSRPADGPAAPPKAPLLGWTPRTCAGAGCELECRSNPQCSGSCGDTCHARCRNATNCSLMTAASADLECREGATCSFIMGGGTLRCRERADCTALCLGPCTVNCEDATCHLQCAADAAPRTVTGTARCN